MRELEKTLAALCAVLFVFAGVITLLSFNIERKAFSSATYKQAFEDQRLYERMPELLAATLQTTISQNPNAFPFLKELSTEDWQMTIAALLPPEELRAIADGALDSTFDYVNSRTNSIVISLLPVKAQLAGPSGVDVIKQFLKTQPECTVEQLTQMGLGFLGGSIALCNPPEQAMGLVEPLIQSQMQTITAAFPDQLTIFSSTDSRSPSDPRYALHLARSLIHFSPFFVFLLFMAIAVFAIRDLKDLFVWWGWPLLIMGGISALLGLVASPLIGALLQFLIETQGIAFLPPLLASSIAETASAVASQMLVPVAIQGLIIAFIGLVMVVIGIFLTRREQEQLDMY